MADPQVEIQSVSAAVSAVAAAVAVFFAWRSADTAEKARKAQFRPQVVVYPSIEDNDVQFVFLNIHNISGAIAKNVRVTLLDHQEMNYTGVPLSEWQPISKGVRLLAPSSKLTTLAFISGPGTEDAIQELVNVRVDYESQSGERLSETFQVDFNYTHGSVWATKRVNGRDPEELKLEALQNISRALNRPHLDDIARGVHALKKK